MHRINDQINQMNTNTDNTLSINIVDRTSKNNHLKAQDSKAESRWKATLERTDGP